MSLADQQWLTARAKVSVLQARGLRVKGKEGAHTLLQVGSQKFSTQKGQQQLADPVWEGQEAAFELAGFPENSATLRVQVLQRALVGPDKLLGQTDIDLAELYSDKSRNKTEWFKLFGKPGKPEKDRGQILLDIQFLKGSMSASMFDLSSQDKSRSKIGKLKDKLRGKKKEGLSDSASAIVPSVTQVMTDSEGEEEEEVPSGEKKKKNKLKSLFAPKSSLHRNTSQSMSTLSPFPERDSAIASSTSSGLNAESPEGKKKFKLFTHKRNSSTDSKVSQSGSKQGGPPTLCVNGSHVYSEEPETKGSTLSLTSSGHGSMEELRREKEERERLEEDRRRREAEQERIRAEKDEEDRKRKEKEEEEQRRKIEEERERMRIEREKEEQRRMVQEERKRKEREEEEQRRKIEEEKEMFRIEREKEEQRRKIEEERKRQEREEEEQMRKIEEEKERLRMEREKEEQRRKIEEEKEKLRIEREKEEQRRKIEEERKRQEREEEEQMRKIEEDKERLRMEREKEEQRRKLEEERRKEREVEQQRKIEEEKERVRLEKEKEEQRRKTEEERKRKEREAEEQRKKVEEEESDRKRIKEEERRLAEERRKRIEEEERLREEEKIRVEMERRLAEERKVREDEERRRRVAEEEAEKRRREAEEKRVREKEERMKMERERKKTEEERKMHEEKERKEKERLRMEEEKRSMEMEERKKKERRMKEEEEEKRLMKEREMQQEQRPVPKARSGKVAQAQEELPPEDTFSSNPFELSCSEDPEEPSTSPSSMNPFEEPTVSQTSASVRSARVSAVKPSMSTSETQPPVLNSNPFLDDDDSVDGSLENLNSIERSTAKKKRAPLPPKNKPEMPSKGVPLEDTRQYSKDLSKRPAPQPPGSQKNTTEEPLKEHLDQCSAALGQGNKETSAVLENRQQSKVAPISKDELKAWCIQSMKVKQEQNLSPQKTDPSQATTGQVDSQFNQNQHSEKQADTNPFTCGGTVPARHNKGPAPAKPSAAFSLKSQDEPSSHSTSLTGDPVQPEEKSNVSTVSESKDNSSNLKAVAEPKSDGTKSELANEVSRKGAAADPLQNSHTDNLNEMNESLKLNAGDQDLFPEPLVLEPDQPNTDPESNAVTETSKRKSRAPQPPAKPKRVGDQGSPNHQPSFPGTLEVNLGHITESQSKTDQDKAQDVASTVYPSITASSSILTPYAESESELMNASVSVSADAGPGSGSRALPCARVVPTDSQSSAVEVKGAGRPPASVIRPHAVKPLNTADKQLDLRETNNSTAAGALDSVQPKAEATEAAGKGPYSQLTRAELVSLVVRQKEQLSQRDFRITELEQYIDNLLVRVMEEQPSILMSLNSQKKAV